MKAEIKYILNIIAIGFFLIASINAQSDRLTGTVYDENGIPIPGITVNLVEAEMTSTTSAEGVYNFVGITDPFCDQLLTLQITLHGYFGTTVQYYEYCNDGTQTVNIFLTLDRAPIMVTNTDDSGPGSLRQAILDANSNPGKDYIHFDVPDFWIASIQPLTSLPVITDEVVINGFTQPGSKMNSNPANSGFNTVLQVELDGTKAGNYSHGLRIEYNNCEIRGLIINRFDGEGIRASSDANSIHDCFIGTDSLGINNNFGNSAMGIYLTGSNSNLIQNCLISGNGTETTGYGLYFYNESSMNMVVGNLIGTDISGKYPMKNGTCGLAMFSGSDNTIGGNDTGMRNIIFGGLTISYGSNNRIINNYLGPDITGLSSIGPGIDSYGVSIGYSANNNEVGPNNVISGNKSFGVLITGDNNYQNRVFGNYIGVAADGNTAMPNEYNMYLDNTSNNRIGGLTADSTNVISGCTYVGILIRRPSTFGNVVVGNLIGTNANGTIAVPNGTNGIEIALGAQNNIIQKNIISGNATHGIMLQDDVTTGNIIIGNLIGTNETGSEAIPNRYGITVWEANTTIIGGTEIAERNIISGNDQYGIDITQSATNTRIMGNFIGTDETGELPIPNAAGILCDQNSTENYIGTWNGGAGNLIAFNNTGITVHGTDNYIQGNIFHDSNYGIVLFGNNNTVGGAESQYKNYFYRSTYNGIQLTGNSQFNLIEGNQFGLDPEGRTDMTDGVGGIRIDGNDHIIRNNLISGYSEYGIRIGRAETNSIINSGNLISGNAIGLNASGDAYIPNGNGIIISRTTDNIVSENIIAGNSGNGIKVFGASTINNQLTRNAIYDNGSLGIDLNRDGVSENDIDPPDSDEGPNHLQNFPVLESISFGEGTVSVTGTLQSEGSSSYNLEFFASSGDLSTYGEGDIYLGSETVVTGGNGEAVIDCTLPTTVEGIQLITATATDVDGNTSEFSQVIGQGSYYLVTNTDDEGEGSLRQAIIDANANPGKDIIQFNIPGTQVHSIQSETPLPTITQPVNIYGFTQPGSMWNTNSPGQGFNTRPTIELDGTKAGDPASGLIVHANECEISGLIVNRYSNRGIALWGDNNTVSECFIGTDPQGNSSLDIGNRVFGIEIDNGDNNTIVNCIISANGGAEPNPGISIQWGSTSNLVYGNLIGTDITGEQATPNSGSGISITDSPDNIIGGLHAAERNIIYGGINLAMENTTGNKIIGNYFGPDVTGQKALGQGGGIGIAGASNNEIGPGNIISGNINNGLWIGNPTTSNNRVFGNYFGLAADGVTPMGNLSSNILIENSPNNRIGGLTADSANVISASINDHGIQISGPSSIKNNIVGNRIGTNAAGDEALGNLWQGVAINDDASFNVIGPGNLISGNSGFGIKIETGLPHDNRIISNLIGVTASGEELLSNRDDGVHIHESYGNLVEGNVICGAGIGGVGNNGIEIYGVNAYNNTISSNYIGTNASSGTNLGNGFNGVHISREAHHNTVGPDNYICNNHNSGILIDSEEMESADNNLVFQNHIGTDLNGNPNLGNGAYGIEIRGNSRSTTVGPDNIIAGSTYSGIFIENAGSTGTNIFQNIIGTDNSNSAGIGNGDFGILLDDHVTLTTIGPGNVVSGNGVGILIQNGSSENTIIGNRVGTTIDGMGALGNEGIGVMIQDSPDNLIGGTEPEDRNLFSGNGMEGLVLVFAGASSNRVIGNYIGTDATGQGLLQNGSGDFGINAAPNNVIGGLNPGERNVIASMGIGNPGAVGNKVIGNYIGIKADGSGPLSEVYYGAGVFISETSDNTIGPGNVISGVDHGIYIHVPPGGDPEVTARNRIIGNYIGTNPDGTSEISNRVGIFIDGATATSIGGSTASESNIISGSDEFGIQLDGPASGTRIENNHIGTDKEGIQPIPNSEGITIGPNAHNNFIGNGTIEGGNLIAFNTNTGIGLGGEDNYVLGNQIHGPDGWGIYIVGNNNVIGGSLEGSGNYIWGDNNGIQIFPDILGTRIEGNVLGTDLEGRKDMTDGWNGIAMSGLNTIVKDNVICGFEHQGILLTRWDDYSTIPSGNQITGNSIGLAPNGEGFIPNGHGISLNTVSDNTITENIIAGNQNHGVAIMDDFSAISEGNLISKNNIFSNGGIGIDLLSNWVTENDTDPLDPDEGPNHLQNFPVLDSIRFGEGIVTVTGTLQSEASSTYILEFFSSSTGDPSSYGEGEFYLGSDTVETDGSGNALFDCTLPTVGYGAQVITATATDEDGNTSEFSQVIGGTIDQVWANMPFLYTLNSDGLPTVPLEDYQNAIRAAFGTWDSIPTAEIETEEAGSSPAKYASASDGINLISFQDDHFPFAKGVLAVTAKTLRMTSGGTTAEILDADIIFNPDYIHDPYHPFAVLEDGDTESQAFDIQAVAAHEIGHGLGLIHSGNFSSSMYFMLGIGTSERSLDLDDKAWASYRYPNGEFQSDFAQISGRVTYGDLGDPENPSTHPPVAGALVLAINTETQEKIHAYTDADGNYTVPIPMQGIPTDEYWIHIQPLDGDVYGTPLTPANISPYIYSHTVFTDFPEEFYDAHESYNDVPTSGEPIQVSAGATVSGINLITNRDETPPEVIVVSPEDASTEVAVSPTLVMKFSEPVDIYSFDENTCFLEHEGETVQGDFTILADSTHIMLMKPVEALQYSTSYTLNIGAITDLKGNALEVPYTTSFETRPPDTDPPTVYDVIPADGSDTVDVTKPVKIFFSEPMNKSSVEGSLLMKSINNEAVEGTFSWDVANKELTYSPDFSLLEGTDYIVQLPTQATDLSGNALQEEYEFSFSTIDVAAPKIVYLGPADGTEGITVETPIAVKVSEPLDVSTITPNSFYLTLLGETIPVSGTYEYLDEDRTIVFRPDQALKFNQEYTITLTSEISDKSSPRQYLEDTQASFRTAQQILTPHIVSMEPPFGAVGTQTSINGYGFDIDSSNIQVSFNGLPAVVRNATLETITVEVPHDAFDGPVSVTVNGVASDNTFNFDVVPPNSDPSYSVIASATTGSRTRSVVISPDAGWAYVTNWGDNTVTAIDLLDGDLNTVFDIPVGIEPMDIDLNPDGTLAYVTNYLSNSVSVIGTDKGDVQNYHKAFKEIQVGYHPYGVAVSTDKKVYVANNESEYVSVIDVDPNSGGFDHVIANLKTGTANRSIVVTPDAALVLVTGDNGVTILDRDPDSPTFNEVIAKASAGTTTRHITITPDAALALATTEDGVILIIDIFQPPGTQFGSVIASVKTGTTARNITISPDAMYVYITNPEENTVSVYKLDYSIIPGYGASLNNPLGLIHVTTIEVGEEPYAIAGHPSAEYLLVTHDTDEGGVSKVGISEESIDPILTLGQLIASVNKALEEELIPSREGAILLEYLQMVRDQILDEQFADALDNINSFIKLVQRFTRTGRIPEYLGDAWSDAADRIRDQIERDLDDQRDNLKSIGQTGFVTGNLNDPLAIDNEKDLSKERSLQLENRPNPFGDHTLINFVIPENDESSVPVSMRVYNTSGQLIKSLVQMHMQPGRYSVIWNTDLDQGGSATAGIYLLELKVPGQRKTIRISVMK